MHAILVGPIIVAVVIVVGRVLIIGVISALHSSVHKPLLVVSYRVLQQNQYIELLLCGMPVEPDPSLSGVLHANILLLCIS